MDGHRQSWGRTHAWSGGSCRTDLNQLNIPQAVYIWGEAADVLSCRLYCPHEGILYFLFLKNGYVSNSSQSGEDMAEVVEWWQDYVWCNHDVWHARRYFQSYGQQMKLQRFSFAQQLVSLWSTLTQRCWNFHGQQMGLHEFLEENIKDFDKGRQSPWPRNQ